MAENEGLPEAAHASVAIGEGMNELEFVVKDRAGNERVGIGALEPLEEVVHEAGDVLGGRGEVNKLLSFGNADRLGAIMACVLNESGHEELVSGKEIAFEVRLPSRHGLVGGKGVVDLVNLLWWAKHSLTCEDGGDLLDGEGVVLDGEGGLNAADALGAPQIRGEGSLVQCFEAA